MFHEAIEWLSDPEGECEIAVLRPDWPAPDNVNAVTTLRLGGVSRPPYNSFNLAAHVDDEDDAVGFNRQLLKRALDLPSEPYWLSQVHGVDVVEASTEIPPRYSHVPPPEADAVHSSCRGTVCAILTADCLPVLFCDQQGQHVAAAHAGWRGLAAGILETTVQAMAVPPRNLLAWMGPAIGAGVFEVGQEVRDAFVRHDELALAAFRPGRNAEHYLADIYELARQRLRHLGLRSIYGGHWCTFEQEKKFYSYRRDGLCGRMASLVWLS